MIKFYVISLQTQTERRKRITKMLQDFGAEFEIFDAVNGRDMSPEDQRLCDSRDENLIIMKGNRKLIVQDKFNAPEAGCALSHLKCYQRIIENGDEAAVILEDDVILHEEARIALESLDAIKEPWDVVNFSSNDGLKSLWGARKYYFNNSKDFYFQRVGMRSVTLDAIFNRRHMLLGAMFYVVTRHACERLVEIGFPARINSDYLLGLIGYNELRTFRVYPEDRFFRFQELASSIGDERPAHRLIRV